MKKHDQENFMVYQDLMTKKIHVVIHITELCSPDERYTSLLVGHNNCNSRGVDRDQTIPRLTPTCTHMSKELNRRNSFVDVSILENSSL